MSTYSKCFRIKPLNRVNIMPENNENAQNCKKLHYIFLDFNPYLYACIKRI